MTSMFAAARRLTALAVISALVLTMTAVLASAQTADAEAPPTSAPLAQEGDEGLGEHVVEILALRSGFLDPPVAAQMRDVIELAEAEGSQLVVLQYSAPGAVSADTDELLRVMADSPVPIAVLLGPIGSTAEAAGAAGLVWLGADIRAVAIDASVGPLDPADLADTAGDYPVGQRTAAFVEAIGADDELAERLLTEAVGAEELVDAGAVSLTAQGLEPLLVELDGRTVDTGQGEVTLRIRADEVDVRFHSLGLVRRLLHAATTAPFIYLLLVVGLGMVLFEVFQPGFGVAGMAGLLTVGIGVFGLTVLPVVWWGVALVILGLILYAVDTAIAGFGPVTLAATAAFVVGSLNFYAAPSLALNGWLVGATTLTAFGFFVFVMTTILRAQAGPEGVAVDDLVGRAGIVRSVLNPEGHVYIDGALWRARWTGDAKRAKVGTPVRVHAVDGPVVLVEPFQPAEVGAEQPAASDA